MALPALGRVEWDEGINAVYVFFLLLLTLSYKFAKINRARHKKYQV
jgi:hypothetical protein